MPELPEVETIKRALSKYLIGHKINSVKVGTTKIFTGDPESIVGAEIKNVRRFAKVLSIDLSNGLSLIIHIKLTGQLIYRGSKLKDTPPVSKKVLGLPGKHTHVIFQLSRNGVLYYNDVRKFGWIKIVKTNEVEKSGFIGKLGPEPFAGLTEKYFRNLLSKYKTPVKILIMDQEKIGGVGNIYANDALWLSRINPSRPSSSLAPKEQIALYKAILEVLKKGIEYGGASELSYVTPEGGEGEYQNHFLVYGSRGKICKRCKKVKIEKFTLGGRGTYYCPNCQNAL